MDIVIHIVLICLAYVVHGSNHTCPECPVCPSTPCTDETCYHGGLCQQEVCQCLDGWTGTYCLDKTCFADENHGELDGNVCDCSENWDGFNCWMCRDDSSCVAKDEEKPVCDKSFIIGEQRRYFECDVVGATEILGDLMGIQCDNLDWELSSEPKGKCYAHGFTENGALPIYSCNFDKCYQTQVRTRPNAKNRIGSDSDYVGIACQETKCVCHNKGKPCEDDVASLLAMASKTGYFHCNTETSDCYFEHEDYEGFLFSMKCANAACEAENLVKPLHPGKLSTEEIVYRVIGGVAGGLALIFFIIVLLTLAITHVVHMIRIKKETKNVQIRGLSIELKNLSYRVRKFPIGKPFILLQDINLSLNSGTLTGIIAKSGAGKSTLLDIMAGRRKEGKVSGQILHNGSTKPPHKRAIGYMFQQEYFMETLSVREVLRFAADLTLPSCISSKEKNERIQEVLKMVQIEHIAKSVVGGTFRRGISGGELKRLALAVHLLKRPGVLYLDEFTSGLDSTSCHLCMKMLQSLVESEGLTIVTSIHQPSSSVFEMLTHVVLLSKGELVFAGKREDAVSHFQQLGYKLKANYNPADYLVDCLSDMESNTQHVELKEVESPKNSAVVTENSPSKDYYEESIQKRTSVDIESSSEAKTVDISAEGEEKEMNVSENSNGKIEEKTPEDIEENKSYYIAYPTSAASQFYYLSKRTARNFFRNIYLFPTHLVASVVLGLGIGFLFFDLKDDIAGSQSRSGIIFLLMFLLASSSMSNLEMFIAERNLFARERASGWYRSTIYFVSKLIFDIVPLRIIPPVLISVCCYWLVGLQNKAANFFVFLYGLVMFNICSGGLSLLVGMVSPTVGSANIIVVLLMLTNSIFAGFLVNRKSLPVALSWIQYLSYWSYTYELLMLNEFIGRSIVLAPENTSIILSVEGRFWTQEFGFRENNFVLDMLMVAGFAVLFLVLSAFLLKICVREKR